MNYFFSLRTALVGWNTIFLFLDLHMILCSSRSSGSSSSSISREEGILNMSMGILIGSQVSVEGHQLGW